MPVTIVAKKTKAQKPKKLKDVINKKAMQEARLRKGLYQSTVQKKPPSKGMNKFIEGLAGTGPNAQYKKEMGQAAIKAIKDTNKSIKKDYPELSKRVGYKAAGGKMSKYYSKGGTVFTGR